MGRAHGINRRKINILAEILMKSKNAGGVLETIKTVVYAVLIALFVRTVAYEPFNIPSGSMVPTLLIGDYLFVSKFSYGYSRYSLPFGLPLLSGRLFFTPPDRGDVAVFKLPRDNATDYIKRIIGLPGDHIQMKSGQLYINGIMAKRDPNGGVDYVPVENLVGRAEFLFFSTDGSAHLWEPWKWPFAIRYNRPF